MQGVVGKYAEHNVAEIIREQRITQPYFTGIASNGTEIALSAAYASPQFENAHYSTLLCIEIF